jgi:hypothetical protein
VILFEVKNAKDDDAVAFDSVEDLVGKPSSQQAAEVAIIKVAAVPGFPPTPGSSDAST